MDCEDAARVKETERERERNIVLPGVARPECPFYEAVNRPVNVCSPNAAAHY